METNTWSDLSKRRFTWSEMSLPVLWDQKKKVMKCLPSRTYDHGDRLWNENIWPPNVNEGSQNCNPEDAASPHGDCCGGGTMQGARWMKKQDWLALDSWGACKSQGWRRTWQPTPVFLPGESHRSLVGCCSQGRRVGHDRSDLAAAEACIFPCFEC